MKTIISFMCVILLFVVVGCDSIPNERELLGECVYYGKQIKNNY